MFIVAMPLQFRLLRSSVSGKHMEYYFNNEEGIVNWDLAGRSIYFDHPLLKYKVIDKRANRLVECIYVGTDIHNLKLLYVNDLKDKKTITGYADTLYDIINQYSEYPIKLRTNRFDCMDTLLFSHSQNKRVVQFIKKYHKLLVNTFSITDSEYTLVEYYTDRIKAGVKLEELFEIADIQSKLVPVLDISKIKSARLNNIINHSNTISKLPKNMSYQFLNFNNDLIRLIKLMMCLNYTDIKLTFNTKEKNILCFDVYTNKTSVSVDSDIASCCDEMIHQCRHNGDEYPLSIEIIKTYNEEGYVKYTYRNSNEIIYFDLIALILTSSI